ncbi:hypothetical protein OsJ_23568 [Oryza sativa Japonica Group]|uniref:Uncharacterized protein n=1 Tax=Oryza sativa subsp. japonica TaxID=39947 RepID=B9FW76_ORYSJ|nr:hypothetical protein OsJ_23568 [Oryza sativa Japonica Group]
MPGLQYIPALAAAGRMDRRMETERRRGGKRRGEPLGSGPNGVGAGWRSGGRWRERRRWRRAEGAMTQVKATALQQDGSNGRWRRAVTTGGSAGGWRAVVADSGGKW